MIKKYHILLRVVPLRYTNPNVKLKIKSSKGKAVKAADHGFFGLFPAVKSPVA